MDVIFEPLSMPDRGAVIKLSDELPCDLWSLVLLGPLLCVVNLRAHFAPFVSATDASLEWMAAVRAPLAPVLAEEFARKSLKKGTWTQLLPSGKAWLRSQGILPEFEELPEGTFDCHPVWTLLARALPYEESYGACP